MHSILKLSAGEMFSEKLLGIGVKGDSLFPLRLFSGMLRRVLESQPSFARNFQSFWGSKGIKELRILREELSGSPIHDIAIDDFFRSPWDISHRPSRCPRFFCGWKFD